MAASTRRTAYTFHHLANSARPIADIARPIADIARLIADSARRIVDLARHIADSFRRIADSFRRIADSFRRIADSFRRIADSARRRKVLAITISSLPIPRNFTTIRRRLLTWKGVKKNYSLIFMAVRLPGMADGVKVSTFYRIISTVYHLNLS